MFRPEFTECEYPSRCEILPEHSHLKNDRYYMDEGYISDAEQVYGYLCMVAGTHFSSSIGPNAQNRE